MNFFIVGTCFYLYMVIMMLLVYYGFVISGHLWCIICAVLFAISGLFGIVRVMDELS